jgi:hypothetical protein
MRWLRKREHRVIVTYHILKPTSRKVRGATRATRNAPGGQRGYYAWCDCGWRTSPRVKELRGPFFPMGYFSAVTETGEKGVPRRSYLTEEAAHQAAREHVAEYANDLRNPFERLLDALGERRSDRRADYTTER